MKPVRLGFIGLGHISTHAHLPGLAPLLEAGEAVLQAFCDASPETLQAQAEVFKPGRTYTDPGEMLQKEDLDAVYICIPPTLHTDEVRVAVDRGMAVFVEKPQTLDMAQAVRFDEAIRRAGVVSQVGFMSRYFPSAEKVKELLDGRIPRHAQVQLFYSGKPIRYWTSRYELCGGSFVENTIHMVDLLRYFLGDITHVTAFYVDRKPGEGPDPMNLPHVYNVNYRFACGATANCTTSRVLTGVRASRREVVVVSDDSLVEWAGQRVVENGEVRYETADRVNPFALQAKAFVEAVGAGDPGRMRSSYADGMNSLAAVLGANASAEAGGAVVSLADFVAGKVVWKATARD